MSLYNDASLLLIPSGYKSGTVYTQKPTDGSGDLTFTRASSATRVNSDGLIEKVRTNLALYSEQFDNAYWGKSFITVTANTIANPLNAGITGDTITPTTDNNVHRLRLNATGLSAGQTYTISFYVKSNGYNFVRIIENTTTGNIKQFNLSNGTIDLGSLNGQIVDAGNGWYRCSAQIVAAASQVIDVQIQETSSTQSFAANGISGIYLFGAQLEVGDIATDYIPTTSAAVSVGMTADVPRLDYTNSSCPSLLLEGQRTNLFTYSEQMDNSWSTTNLTITANATTSPDGTQNADLLDDGTASATLHWIYQSPSFVNSTAYTISFYAKYVSRKYMAVNIYNGSTSQYVTYDIQNGSVFGSTGDVTASITSVGDGWYRIVYTRTIAASGSPNFRIALADDTGNITYTGSNKQVYMWGAQLEVGSYPTSYIPTLGTSVTRVADVCSKTGISSLIGQTEGTMFAEINIPSIATAGTYSSWQLDDGSTNNRISFTYYSTGRIQAVAFVGGSLPVNIDRPSFGLTEGNHKIAFAYKLNDYVLYVDGLQVGSDTSAQVPAMSKCDLFNTLDGTTFYKQFVLFKTRLSNTDCEVITGTSYDSYSAMATALNYTVL